MLKEEKAILKSIHKDPFFKVILEKLSVNIALTSSEKAYILASAILFLKHYEQDNKHTSFADFAYYIILKYSLEYSDYKPLYDFSVNFGFYPISKSILDNNLLVDYRLRDCFVGIELNRFKNVRSYVETLEQNIESEKFLEDNSREKSFLAPTSFGKSSVIVENIKVLPSDTLKIAIIVPTKSLLMQTHQMIRAANLKRKIIIHDEMYNNDSSFIAVFTQERALRLLNRSNIYFDVLYIDEAHNLLKKNDRSILLSRLIAKNRILNPNQKVIYLSPLIENVENLKILKDQRISLHNIKFNIKEPEIFEYRIDHKIYMYNRFLDQFYEIGKEEDYFRYVLKESKNKNFIYNYRPIKIELLAKDLVRHLPKLVESKELLELAKTLTKEVHKDFYIINYLKYGVVYLHGKLPDIIKEYIESKFRNLSELKYVIANSVILEGMNLPIDCLFIFNTRSLHGKELMNLIGRVNRLNDIFSLNTNKLKKLLPKIYFINSLEYNRADSKMENQIKMLRSRVFNDSVENPILSSFDFDKLKIKKENKDKVLKEIKVLQDNEKFLYSENRTDRDILKKYVIETGICNFYNDLDSLIEHFILIQKQIGNSEVFGWKQKSMMDKIEFLFIRGVNSVADYEFYRLKFEESRNYYENHIRIGQKKSLNENINSQFEYFKEKATGFEPKLYIGEQYGEEPYELSVYPSSNRNVFVDLSKKSDLELINLAIVKLKIEDDFISFKLNKFIVMMYDFDLISKDEYNLYIYGTIDDKKIALTKYGFSISLTSRLENDGQLGNLYFDEYNNLKGTPNFEKFKESIDDFYKFEISRFLS